MFYKCCLLLFINTSDSFAIPIVESASCGVFKRLIMAAGVVYNRLFSDTFRCILRARMHMRMATTLSV